MLSDVMALLRTEGHVYGRIELSGPFGFAFPHQYGTCLAVVRGECLLDVADDDPILLAEGDFAFLPGSSIFHLRSERRLPAELPMSAEQLAQWPSTRRLTHDGGQGQHVSIISGCFTFASPENHLLIDQLPPIVHLPACDADPSARHLMALMAAEIEREDPGASTIIDRLAEVLLLQSIRRCYAHASVQGSAGWLRGLGDRRIRAALTLMHGELAAPWTVERVARDIGMSRSAFAARFREIVGKTPLEHLTEWRMAYAAGLIRQHPEMKINAIAEASGYQSESSFRKAFQKVMDRSPKTYREEAG